MKVPWTSGFHFYAYFGMRYSDPLDNPQLAQSNDDQRKLDFDPAKSNQGETVNRTPQNPADKVLRPGSGLAEGIKLSKLSTEERLSNRPSPELRQIILSTFAFQRQFVFWISERVEKYEEEKGIAVDVKREIGTRLQYLRRPDLVELVLWVREKDGTNQTRTAVSDMLKVMEEREEARRLFSRDEAT
ncbi:hypothetical protein F5Y02DRAFT_398196, partial [Annulohypoxylon stygium]